MPVLGIQSLTSYLLGLQVLQAALAHESIDVRLAAMRAATAFIQVMFFFGTHFLYAFCGSA